MIPLQNLKKHIIDLKKSGVDTRKSDVGPGKAGKYVYSKEKVIYKKSDRPSVILKWCTMPQENQSNPKIPLTEAWKYTWGFDFVKASDFDYAVEGVTPNSLGYFQVGDAVLMKIPTDQYIAKVLEERQTHANQLKQQNRNWKTKTKKSGAVLKDDVVSDILGMDAEPQR